MPESSTSRLSTFRGSLRVNYKTTDYYAPEHERTLARNDRSVRVLLPLEGEPRMSDKDRRGTPLGEAETYP